MSFVKILQIFILGAFCFSASVFAAETAIVEDDAEGEPSLFSLSVGTYVAAGTAVSKNGTIASRSMNSATGYLWLGHKSGYISPFLFAEYSGVFQSTESSRVSGTNITGAGFNAGIGIKLHVFRFFLSGAYLPLGSFELSRKTTDSQVAIYSAPTSGLFFIGYRTDQLSFFIVHKVIEYSRLALGPTSSSLGDDKFVQTSLGGGIEWSF